MGGSGGASSSKSESGPPRFARKIAKEQWQMSKPVSAAVGQFLQAAMSGDFSKIPWLNNVVEGGRQVGARALQQTQEGLARANVGGTFAQGTLANQRQQGEFNINQLIAQVLQAIVGQTSAQGYGFMTGQPAVAGASGIPKSSSQSFSTWGGGGVGGGTSGGSP